MSAPAPRPVVAVFGSSTLTRDEPAWEVARELGARLADAGWVVMNGGYQGAMEAVSEGARSAGGGVIGVTVSLFNHRGANPHLTERRDTATLLERLDVLMNTASAFVVLEGSIGTLAEMFLAWNLLAVDAVAARAPIVCLGRPYAKFLEAVTRPHLVDPAMIRHVRVADTPAQAVELLAPALPAAR